MAHGIEPYDRQRDLEAVIRIWREVGWIDDDTERHAVALDRFLEASNVEVALLDDQAECAVTWVPGSIRYQGSDLPLCAVTAVTTSRVARKHGFATSMTARAIGRGAEAGAAVAALGMFEQGFYDRVGFGSGAYSHRASFDPSTLAVDHVPYRSRPVRLTADDADEIHALMARRARPHGGVVVGGPAITRAELEWLDRPFGLGYREADGRLTHVLCGEARGEHGPYAVRILGYEEPYQLLELLRLLFELADQVTSVQMVEPPEIQLQDLVVGPLTQIRRTRSSPHETGIRSMAWMQLRILDLAACVAARAWSGPEVAANLVVHDPATDILDRSDGVGWSGLDGEYVVRVGTPSTVEPGCDPGLPTLRASINAFSRCWFGVRPASSLALTDDLDGPAELLAALDEALALPPPHPGWDF